MTAIAVLAAPAENAPGAFDGHRPRAFQRGRSTQAINRGLKGFLYKVKPTLSAPERLTSRAPTATAPKLSTGGNLNAGV